MPTKPRISTATPEQVEAARQRFQNETVDDVVPCKWCSETFKRKRRWQDFCCPEHRALWHKQVRESEVALLKAEIETLKRTVRDLEWKLEEARSRGV